MDVALNLLVPASVEEAENAALAAEKLAQKTLFAYNHHYQSS